MTGALARCADSYLLMLDEPWRARRLALLRRVLLGVAVLASASVATVLGFAVYMFAEGYSGGSSPHGVASLAFPMSFLVVIFAGLPCALVCALAWAGYFAAARRTGRGG
jgi:hypothetical protein